MSRSIIQQSAFSIDSLPQKFSFCPSCQLVVLKPQLKRPCPYHHVSFIQTASCVQTETLIAGVGLDFGHDSSSRNVSLVYKTAVPRNARATLRSSQVYAVLKAVEKAREMVLNSQSMSDRLKWPGRIRSFAGQIGDDWEMEDGVGAEYTTPLDLKEVCILTSSIYLLDSITMDKKPWAYNRSGNSAARGRSGLAASKKRNPTPANSRIEIITNYKPSKSWFKVRKYPSPLDWDMFKEIEHQVGDLSKRGVIVSFIKGKKEGRKGRAFRLANDGANKGLRRLKK